jgi:hypothetical protein
MSNPLRRLFLACAVSGLLSNQPMAAQAGDVGSAAEAHAMLQRVVVALTEDRERALVRFTDGQAGFRDRDLYPFCATEDGTYTAHPALDAYRRWNLRDLQDKAGKALGEELVKAAREGEIAEVEYAWPHPGSDIPVAKAVYVTRVADQICGVRFYK